ncbi:MAG: hypothetical protein DKINENOH_02262 [bacterium]|nr:hypothetical protein [bacterium]
MRKLRQWTPLWCAMLFAAAPLLAQHQNVLVSNLNYPNEPCIAIDPNNTGRMVAAANLNNFYYSSDAGLTWTAGRATSIYGVWGDPVVVADYQGSFYYFHLSNPPNGNWIDRIVCQKSTDGGKSWSRGTFMGLVPIAGGAKAQDKEWAVVDRNNHIYVTWTQFDRYGSAAPQDSSNIRFAKSTDGGETWSEPVRINQVAGDAIDSDNTVEGAVPAIGPQGEIYVAWAGPAGIVFDKSTDGGETWLADDIFIDAMPGGWNFSVPGIYRCNGFPVTVCDLSDSPQRGTIYVNWSDQRNGEHDTDIWLAKSHDGGLTWSAPIRVNDDSPGRHQFFTWMTIDQVNGTLYFVFYDRRNYSDNRTDVFMAMSRDGGATFTNFQVSESPFTPRPEIFFGDYTSIAAHNNVVRPIWTRLNNVELSLLTAIVDLDQITGVQDRHALPPQTHAPAQNFPNPFDEATYLSFKLHRPAILSLKIYDLLGREVATVIDRKPYGIGQYVESFQPRDLGLPSGAYYYVLQNGSAVMRNRMIYVK